MDRGSPWNAIASKRAEKLKDMFDYSVGLRLMSLAMTVQLIFMEGGHYPAHTATTDISPANDKPGNLSHEP